MPDEYDGATAPVEMVKHADGTWRPLNLPPAADRYGRPYLTCPICHNVTGCVTEIAMSRHVAWHHPAPERVKERSLSRRLVRWTFRGIR